jgi:hypothetical protein
MSFAPSIAACSCASVGPFRLVMIRACASSGPGDPRSRGRPPPSYRHAAAHRRRTRPPTS